MRDLSYQDALDDPELPFQLFVQRCVGLWNRAVEIYEENGSPNGPAEAGDNLTSWVLTRLDTLAAIGEAEELLLGLEQCDD